MPTLLAALKTQPDAPVLQTDPAIVDKQYRYWRVRILATTIFGYAFYYFVRTNINVPLKAMSADTGYSKERLGIILSAGGIVYGVSKFINGFLGDHANPRVFMAVGLLACAGLNVWFGLSSSLALFIVIWMMNNYAQGMGFPPCAKSMGYWFSPRERSTTFGIWHTSHMIGAALISALTGYLVHYFGWRSCFYVPAAIAAFGAIVIFIFLRDTPGSLGLPPVEVYKGEESPEQLANELKEPVDNASPIESLTYGQLVWRYVLTNPYMWIISVANLTVYVMRDIQTKWGPTFLQETKGVSDVTAGWLGFGSEMGGMVAALVGGIIADRLFRGRAGRVCVIAMALMAAAVFGFMHTPATHPFIAGSLYVCMGFLLYVPQMLIAAMAMNLGTKRASAAAVGLTGIVGYMSNIFSGWGIGHLADRHGWNDAFLIMLACACITFILMALTWNVGAHTHTEAEA